MAILVLKQNTPEIREKIKQAGIEVCECAEFKDSVWLSYTGATPNKIHGVGYHDEYTKSTHQELERFKSDNPYAVYCEDVDSFINGIGIVNTSNDEMLYDMKKEFAMKEIIKPKVILPVLSRQTIVPFATLPYIIDGNSLNAQELAFEVVKRIVEDYNKHLKNKSGFIVVDDEKISTDFYPDIKFEYAKIDGERYKLDFKVEFKRRYDEKEEAK